jgi:hypothetical protein
MVIYGYFQLLLIFFKNHRKLHKLILAILTYFILGFFLL